MATVLKTVMTYPLDGQTTDFTIPFEYLARKFVKVTLLGRDRKELSLNTDYRFATRTTLSLTRAWGPSDGYAQIEMRRYTSASERLVDFTDGSILRAYDLNVAQLQTMHIAEEARDLTADTIGVNSNGDLDARGHRIINVANAHEDGDAVSLGTLKGFSNNAWQARDEAEGFRNEAAKSKLDAEAAAGRADSDADKAAAEAGKAKQWADKAQSATSGIQAEADKVHQAASKVQGSVEEAEKFAMQAREGSVVAERAADNAQGEAESAKREATRAKSEADRAKAEADKIAGTNQISVAIEGVTSEAVAFNRGVTARSHLRCMTTGGNLPFTGVRHEGGAELYMTVDSNGNAGFTTDAPSSSPKFRAYWDTQGATYVSTATTNLDQGSRQIKGSLEVGQGSNSAIHTFSKGEGNPNELVSATKWKWRNGGVELGTMRGKSDECTGIISTTSGGSKVSYKQDADEGTHVFLGDADKTVLTIHKDGDIETPLLGRLSEKLSGGGGSGGGGDSDPDNWKLVGIINPQNDSNFTAPFKLTGRRGYVRVTDRGTNANIFITYPPFDCTFQLSRGPGICNISMEKDGMVLRRKTPSLNEGDGIYKFYAYNPDHEAQGIKEEEELDAGYGVFEC